MTRHYSQDAITEVYNQIKTLGITMYRNIAPTTATGEYIVLNYIASNRDRAVSNLFVNVNFFCPKIDGEYINDSRNNAVEKLIIEKIESFEDLHATSTVNFMKLTIESDASVFNENENMSLMSVRVNVLFS